MYEVSGDTIKHVTHQSSPIFQYIFVVLVIAYVIITNKRLSWVRNVRVPEMPTGVPA